MSGPIAPFAERYRKALTDGQLGRNLLNFQRAYGDARRAAFGLTRAIGQVYRSHIHLLDYATRRDGVPD